MAAVAVMLVVAAFGYMKSPRARVCESSVPGGWMIELNRMWLDDSLGRNSETILLGASFKLLKRLDPTIVAVQSFADGRCGCGTIYKAANVDYYGYHWTTFLHNRRSGEVNHEQNLTNATCASGFMRTNAELLAGDVVPFRAKTYRYIYPLHRSFRFIGNGKKLPFPPYEKGTEPATWYINPERLRPRLIAALDTLLERWHQVTAKVQGGMQPDEAYETQLDELRQRQTQVPWAKLEAVLSEEAERVFRRRLRDAIWDSLMLARPLKPGAPKETQEVFLTDLLGDLDAVEEISPVGGQIYQRYLWTADGRTTDDLAEAVVAELRAEEPQASASGRDLKYIAGVRD